MHDERRNAVERDSKAMSVGMAVGYWIFIGAVALIYNN